MATRGKTPQARRTSDPSPATPADEPLAIDAVLANLERVVHDLEAGELPLEAALQRFEEGVRLARQGGKLLDGLEQRVEVLLADRDATAPFHDGDGDAEDDDDDDDEHL